jgi:hypothetical protein
MCVYVVRPHLPVQAPFRIQELCRDKSENLLAPREEVERMK